MEIGPMQISCELDVESEGKEGSRMTPSFAPETPGEGVGCDFPSVDKQGRGKKKADKGTHRSLVLRG